MSETRIHCLSRYFLRLTAAACAVGLFLGQALSVRASSDAELALEANRGLPVQSNEVPNWPAGPAVGAESAILIEAQTGTILYAKNIHQREYPIELDPFPTMLSSIRPGTAAISPWMWGRSSPWSNA